MGRHLGVGGCGFLAWAKQIVRVYLGYFDTEAGRTRGAALSLKHNRRPSCEPLVRPLAHQESLLFGRRNASNTPKRETGAAGRNSEAPSEGEEGNSEGNSEGGNIFGSGGGQSLG